jgi:hypothetical protein
LFAPKPRPQEAGRPIEFSLAEIGRLQGYASASLSEAEVIGREPSVLRYMQDLVTAQFIARSETEGRSLERVILAEQRSRLRTMFEHSCSDDTMGSALLAFKGFPQFYHAMRNYLASLGAMQSERMVDRSIVTMRRIAKNCVQERIEPSERERLAYVNAAREGASACRVAGRGIEDMVSEIRRDPALKGFALTELALGAIERDHLRARSLAGPAARTAQRRDTDLKPAPRPFRDALNALIRRS